MLFRSDSYHGTCFSIIFEKKFLSISNFERGEKRVKEVDTKTKVFTIHTEDTQAEGLLSGTYDYSIEKDTLTLTEREYGDQLVFVKREKK